MVQSARERTAYTPAQGLKRPRDHTTGWHKSPKTALAPNQTSEMIAMYWDIGCMIAACQKEEGWGAGVIPRLAVDLKNELPKQK